MSSRPSARGTAWQLECSNALRAKLHLSFPRRRLRIPTVSFCVTQSLAGWAHFRTLILLLPHTNFGPRKTLSAIQTSDTVSETTFTSKLQGSPWCLVHWVPLRGLTMDQTSSYMCCRTMWVDSTPLTPRLRESCAITWDEPAYGAAKAARRSRKVGVMCRTGTLTQPAANH